MDIIKVRSAWELSIVYHVQETCKARFLDIFKNFIKKTGFLKPHIGIIT